MTERTSNAVQAATVAALVALLLSGVLMLEAEPINGIVLVASVTVATFIVTLALWWLVFASAAMGKWHGLWVGSLIVMLAMLVTMVALAVFLGGHVKHVVSGSVIAALGLYLVGRVLIPLGAISAVLIRWRQLRAEND